MANSLSSLIREPRKERLAREMSHPGYGYTPSLAEINQAINVGMGRLPADIAYGEQGLQAPAVAGGLVSLDPTDYLSGAGLAKLAAMAKVGGLGLASLAGGMTAMNRMGAKSVPIMFKQSGSLAGKGAKTEFELAHEVAQRNAALPVEQGGLGLPPNNTAMDRAKAMGFDTPAYHGTKYDFPEFDPSKAMSSSGHASSDIPAIWASGRPEVANIFATGRVSDAYPISTYGNQGGGVNSIRTAGLVDGGNVMPLMIRTGDDIKTMKAGEAQKLILGAKGEDHRDAGDEFVKRYYELGAPDVLKIKGHPLSELEFRANQYLLKDTSNIRSRFAAFDPIKRNSANILAGGAAGAVGLTSLADLMSKGEYQ